MKTRAWGNEFRLTQLCVDSYDDGVLCGRVYNPYKEGGVEFKSLSQFLVLMEDILDEMDFPQPFTETRSFAPPMENFRKAVSSDLQYGKLATFSISIIFRQHTSWQGYVVWNGTNKEERFRSALELILLIDGALRIEQADTSVLNAGNRPHCE
jgi:hypothetical protein